MLSQIRLLFIPVFIIAVTFGACRFKSKSDEDIQKSQTKLEVVTPVDEIHTPQDALSALEAGNKRFQNGQFEHIHIKRIVDNEEDEVSPFVAVLACNDSKIPPEILFDMESDNVFVIRTPANVEDPLVLRSIDSIAALGNLKLVLVLGHDQCTAIRNAVYHPARPDFDGELREKLDDNLAQLSSDTIGTVNLIAQKNISQTLNRIAAKDNSLKLQADSGNVMLMGAFYNAKEGTVTYGKQF